MQIDTQSNVMAVGFNARHIVTSSARQSLTIWDMATLQNLYTIKYVKLPALKSADLARHNKLSVAVLR